MSTIKIPNHSPPWGVQWRSSTSFIVATVWMATFTEFFLFAMIVPVMPTALITRAHVLPADRQYWSSVLLMCDAGMVVVCCPFFGFLVDRTRTRQLPFLSGLILLAASMILLAVGKTLSIFLIARLLQGAATAMVCVAGLTLTTDTFEKERLGTAIGYLGSATTMGFVLGPSVGGVTYSKLGYEAVFIISAVLIGIDFVLRLLLIEKKVAIKWIQPGADILSGDDEVLLDCDGQRVAPGGVKVLLKLLKEPRMLITLGGLCVIGILNSTFDATMPVFVESSYHWSPIGAGLIFLPSALVSLLGPYSGSLCDRYGPRIMIFLGFLFLVPTQTCLAFVGHNSFLCIIALIGLMCLSGLFTITALPSLYVESQSVLDDMEREKPGVMGSKGAVAQAFALQTMAQFIGLFLGPLWASFIMYRFGWAIMCWTLAFFSSCRCSFSALAKWQASRSRGGF
ncbi:Major facilitator superfamily domain general substrate transporter [Penicillium verrucosum]|uniref:Major facilitator superfamily domain general substrate transporter n=1 Tax=Penicillium verrucosum TaxID=60171 RepID=UPI002545AF33|nr:Major facilitator superfamily domain general substrate transporter [Penicillium verrucosum]KAJ5922475.1 Major facilitator superfamily domain general substrate transporter [Penicillium verrucosum]